MSSGDQTAAEPIGQVAEIQGLYGAFSFPEKLLQQIWARQEFLTHGLRTVDGRSVRVIRPGRWNRLGGPDFLGASIELGDTVIEGDIEVHLRASDWTAHGHAGDRAYDGVALHVVLFGGTERFTRGAGGREIPVVSLLAHLQHDLEEYAAEAAIERMASKAGGDTAFFDAFSQRPLAEARAMLATFAERRWAMKIQTARKRVRRLGWEEACHLTALEILGYRHNRAGMLLVAEALPFAHWRGGESANPAPASLVETALAIGEGQWSRQGVRPANLPAARLRQYQVWCAARPDWPTRLAESLSKISLSNEAAAAGQTTALFRRQNRLAGLSRALRHEVTGDAIGGGRLDTLVCDGFLPLWVARGEGVENPREAATMGAFWFHWPMGDLPDRITATLRRLELIGGRDWPASHGVGQGALGWLWANESSGAGG